MLHLHFSNRYECLLAELLAQLGDGGGDPLRSDPVIVPSIAHRRALTLAIADREGVCADAEFAFLAQWLWQQAARFLPVQAESPFEPAQLAWRVYQALGDAAFVARFERLQSWLSAAGADEAMRYELATRVAALLGQYLTYRDQLLLRWQQGGATGTLGVDEDWQAALWQRIAADMQVAGEHPFELLVQQLASGGAGAGSSQGLPSRVHVFGLSSMPPLYLRALQQLSRWTEVRLYVLNPCREYWFDLVDARRQQQLRARGIDSFEEGPRLLVSWGRQAQSQLESLLQAENVDSQVHEHYEAAPSPSLLGQLQDALLDLQEIEPGSLQWHEGDRSLEIHACHSLTRELEVLHDHLLALFKADPRLRAGDVLVVTPDLEAAAPLIDAVFGSVPAERRIPFEISGLGRARANQPVRAFLDVLALAASRCTATELHGLLQQPVVARRFGLDEAGLQQVHEWLLEAGVHWALDEDHLRSEGLPVARHTLAAGLERLFLGYAMPDGAAGVLGDLLPSGRAEGSAALPLGALQAFADELRALRRQLAQARPPAQWRQLLHELVECFIDAPTRELEDVVELHGAIDEVVQAMEGAGLQEPVPASVLRQALQAALEDPARGGVPTGRVTFTGMSTLRGLAFPVICAIGLDDGAFPRTERPVEFDLIARHPRPGDRQRGADQRNLFLDLLLAARSSFYASYTGRSIRDNAVLPPSVLVSELLDVLVPGLGGADPQALRQARARLLVEHPLQPFAPESFSDDTPDPRLRSFDAELARALRESAAGRPLPVVTATVADDEDEAVEELVPAFFTGPLAPPEERWRDVPLRQLVAFWRDPSRFLLERRLGLELPRDEQQLVDDEPLLVSFPARSALAQRLLPALLAGDADLAQARQRALAGTEWPEGALGAEELEAELARLDRFSQAVRQLTREAALPAHSGRVPLSLAGEDWRVEGGFADLRPPGRVAWRYDDERASDQVQAWIEHLFLCALAPAGVAACTQSVARNGVRSFPPLDQQQASQQLATLVEGYRDGLSQPLRFFPKPASKLVGGSLAAALNAWRGHKAPGDKDKASYRLAFRGDPDPLNEEFEAHAKAVFEPLQAGSTWREWNVEVGA
ncbi:exodeoxyribonuclease V subunit gamma [Ramlibacter tataouinensis]|uniref:exodeoxyribonuclease V subunit gamma n=1 Tax=Ramlibacter tataouinensis TaxID=94132 RepID=UPI0022F3E908|nr:exodeoxyribonuclease V subunit gamma [Ramlibacter tataouinensis]WBY02823.1 exodeoxyribonuclease V subunit gamma [Ramlibacter tataouinensis]